MQKSSSSEPQSAPTTINFLRNAMAAYKSLSKTNGDKQEAPANGVKKNKQRVLILSSRGITYRYILLGAILQSCVIEMLTVLWDRHRHLLNDLASLLPHSRKDAKLDTKTKLYQLNELADLYNCNNVFFFEARKGKDLYIWMSKAPNGPTVKMHMQNCTSSASPAIFSTNCQTRSTHNGRTPFHRQLSQRLPPHPLLRRLLR